MILEHPRSKSNNIINLQDQYLNSIMDVRTLKNPNNRPLGKLSSFPYVEVKKLDYHRSFPQGHGKRMFPYFTLESLFLLVCLTVSLLILPLVLPPLPPPPFMLLLLPIFILALLMVLAFMPSGVREATHTCV